MVDMYLLLSWTEVSETWHCQVYFLIWLLQNDLCKQKKNLFLSGVLGLSMLCD